MFHSTYSMHIQLPQSMQENVSTTSSMLCSPLSENSPKGKCRDIAPFLRNLRNILDNEELRIISWSLNGTAIEIHDMKRLIDEILPKYFKHNKYTSFQRQLNYFHFKKWTKSRSNVCTFSNPMFLRDEPNRCIWIQRKRSNSRDISKGDDIRMNSPTEPLSEVLRQDLNWLAEFEFLDTKNSIEGLPTWKQECHVVWPYDNSSYISNRN